MKNYSEDIACSVKSFLDEDDWTYQFDEKRGIFRFGLNIRGKLKNIQYFVSIDEHDYNVYAISPISADEDDEEQMQRMAEFICRANYGMRDGNFEMDFSDGEIRFKAYVNCDGIIPSKDIIERSIHCPGAMFKRYGKGIVQIMFTDISPKEAVDLCEKGSRISEIEEEESRESSSLSDEETSDILSLLRRMQEEMEGRDDSEDSDDPDDEEDQDVFEDLEGIEETEESEDE